MKFSNLKGIGIMGWLRPVSAACLLAAASLPIFAADANDVCLNVELRNGQTDEYLLSEKPEITFSGDRCVIVCKNIDTSYDMSDVLKATFVQAGVSVAENAADRIRIDLTDPAVAVVSGLTPGAPVTLYGVDGTVIVTVMADADGSASIALSELASGTVYVVSINSNKNFKLYKK